MGLNERLRQEFSRLGADLNFTFKNGEFVGIWKGFIRAIEEDGAVLANYTIYPDFWSGTNRACCEIQLTVGHLYESPLGISTAEMIKEFNNNPPMAMGNALQFVVEEKRLLYITLVQKINYEESQVQEMHDKVVATAKEFINKILSDTRVKEVFERGAVESVTLSFFM